MTSNLIAESFPELVFLVMRENIDKPSFRLSEIVEEAQRLNIVIKIESRYDQYSPEWIEVLNGALKRDSGNDNANNEGLVCLFQSVDRACTEPWTLSTLPLNDETYAAFRYRVRGGHTSKQSAKAAAEKAKKQLFERPALTVMMNKEPLRVIAPDDQDGDGEHYICVFENAVEYRNGENATHRSGGMPAFFEWMYGNEKMTFCENGREHRLDGPAVIGAHKEEDVLYINGEMCGEVGDKEASLRFEREYKKQKGEAPSPMLMKRLQMMKYKNFDDFHEEMAQAKALTASLDKMDETAA